LPPTPLSDALNALREGSMTVSWMIKVAKDWWEEHWRDLSGFDEVDKRFGYWCHSMSYESSLKLSEEVEKYLEARGVDFDLTLSILRLFWVGTRDEVEYNGRVCEVLREALEHVAKVGGDSIARLHARSLVKLVVNAERLKSNIVCCG